jgi:hypothetical protein
MIIAASSHGFFGLAKQVWTWLYPCSSFAEAEHPGMDRVPS